MDRCQFVAFSYTITPQLVEWQLFESNNCRFLKLDINKIMGSNPTFILNPVQMGLVLNFTKVILRICNNCIHMFITVPPHPKKIGIWLSSHFTFLTELEITLRNFSSLSCHVLAVDLSVFALTWFVLPISQWLFEDFVSHTYIPEPSAHWAK